MSAEVIRVTISPTCEVSVEVVGGQGGSCTNLTAALESALGVQDNKVFKPEFFNQDQRIRTTN
jgi:hypothetical protein